MTDLDSQIHDLPDDPQDIDAQDFSTTLTHTRELAIQETLTSAVRSLTKTVEALHETVKDKYVERRELENYYTRKDRHRRTTFASLVVLFALLGSSVMVMGVANYCLLQGQRRTVCTIIPGYNQTMDRFQANRELTDKRELRISLLEQQVKDLQAQQQANEQQADPDQ